MEINRIIIILSIVLGASFYCVENVQPSETPVLPEEQILVSLLTEEIKIDENKDIFSDLEEEDFSEEIDLLSDVDIEILNELLLEP